MKKYIAIDFDGTIVTNAYPEVGELIPHAVEVIQKWHKSGHKIIINTCRSGNYEQDARDFLELHNIPFDTLNENHPELIEKFDNDCRKLGADVYIDDRNILMGEIDWLAFDRAIDRLVATTK